MVQVLKVHNVDKAKKQHDTDCIQALCFAVCLGQLVMNRVFNRVLKTKLKRVIQTVSTWKSCLRNVGLSDLALVLDVLDDIVNEVREVSVLLDSSLYAVYRVNDSRVVTSAEL